MKTLLEKRARIVLANIQGRLKYSAIHGFEHYGGKGIKNHLTRDEIVQLMIRDNVEAMQKPSIDRIDSRLNYVFENCRFVEHRANCGVHTVQVCHVCGGPAKHRNFCRVCRKQSRKTRHICVDCKVEFIPKRITNQSCESCSRVSRPCGYCGLEVVRFKNTNIYGSTRTNKQWFCSKSHQGKTLANLRSHRLVNTRNGEL